MEQWLDQLAQLYMQFNAYAKTNQVIAGVVSLWGLGVLTFLLRNVPLRIWNFVSYQSTTRLTFTSDPIGVNAQTFVNFMMWFEENQGRWRKFSRSIAVNSADTFTQHRYGREYHGSESRAGIGNGWHFFFYKGRPMWMMRRRLETSTMNALIYEISVVMLGRDRQRLLDLVDDFKYVPPQPEESLGVFSWIDRSWVRAHDIPPRPLNTVVINPAIKNALVADIRRWRESRTWYEERGLPYKLSCLLTGMPGTGKTSLIKALASHFGMNLYLLNLNKMTDETLPEALSEVGVNSIIVIEDFDSTSATRARPAMKRKEEEKNKKLGQPSDRALDLLEEAGSLAFGLTLSGILNALDGLVSLHNKLVFLTTNVRENIDPALLRKGRIDLTYEIGALRDSEVREYIQLMFPGTEVDVHPFADILGCDLQDLYFRNRDDATAFVDSIPRYHATLTLVTNDVH